MVKIGFIMTIITLILKIVLIPVFGILDVIISIFVVQCLYLLIIRLEIKKNKFNLILPNYSIVLVPQEF